MLGIPGVIYAARSTEDHRGSIPQTAECKPVSRPFWFPLTYASVAMRRVAIVALGVIVLAGCGGTDEKPRLASAFANQALYCVSIRAPGDALVSGLFGQRKDSEEGRRDGFVRNPAAPPVTPEETLLVKWPDGEIVTAKVYASEAEADRALAYPAIPGDRVQRYGVVATEWEKPPTAVQQRLLRGCDL